MRRIDWILILAGAIILWGLFPGALGAQSVDRLTKSIQNRNSEIQRLINERKDTLRVMEKIKKNEWRVLEVLRVINTTIETTRSSIEELEKTIAEAREIIEKTNFRVRGLNIAIRRTREWLRQHMKAIFFQNHVRKLTPFLGMNSFENYFRNAWLLRENSKSSVRALVELKENITRLRSEEERLILQQAELGALLKSEEEQKELLSFEKNQQATYLHHIRKDHALRLKYLAEIQATMEELNDLVYSLERKKESEKKAKAFQGFRKKKNRLPAPVKGTLNSRFGNKGGRYKNLFHRGVLVTTTINAEAHSILAGKVVFAGPFKGYQQLIILDHGKNSFSIYGNLKELMVRVDDIVDQRVTLGTVAYDNMEKASLFYFETRYNKRAVDPMQWLKRGSWR